MAWQCDGCGFFNKNANNVVCGGTGPMGCKQPWSGGGGMAAMGGGYGPQRTARQNPAASWGQPLPYAKAASEWQCQHCSFTNKAGNEVCGGNGPMGCKSPSGFWQCNACSFSNKPGNQVCGGTGPAGCKSPNPAGSGGGGGGGQADMMAARMKMMMGVSQSEMMGSKGKGKSQGKISEWKCPSCSFSNKLTNEVCGGNGPMGCKEPRTQAGTNMKHSSEWKCACGFMNRLSNEVCGGEKGTMGCKEPAPAGMAGKGAMIAKGKGNGKGPDWLCSCGFVNKPQNTICGGSGPMGCNKANKVKAEAT